MNAAASPGVWSPARTRPWLLSVVVPVQGGDPDPLDLADRLRHLPGGPPHEIILVATGTDTMAWARLQQAERSWDSASTALVALRSSRGLGTAYRAGIAASSGDRVLLTVADLPFGTSDLQAVLACRALPRLAIGSRAHPRSRVPRTVAQHVSTSALRAARKLLLGLDVGDPGGTLVMEGNLARRLAAGTTLPGAGMITELVALAARDGTAPIELPVAAPSSHEVSRRRDAVEAVRTLADLLRLRHRLGARRRPVIALPDRTSPPTDASGGRPLLS